ncbi:MAG: NADH-quinone oxidoreductase subunit L [Acidobacteria bacterium]|nr:NADH-quinone oxidoreductase subunit L [Acidobacteriota bacterium]
MSESTASAITLLLLIAAAGKSAQIPLYLWLPDAMAGPTPVSALIHAATMVTSGVYLLIRMNPVLEASAEWATTTIAWVGAITALFAASIAVAQNDIKKVLAYSTISQLGYMFLAIGLGGYVAAVFHMVTHACFKALLFLGSGSVIHGMDGDQDMRHYGRLAKVMPITAITFIIGWLAISGVPPFSGFWSKDEVLLVAFDEGGWGKALWVIGILVALLTAFYMTRQVVLTFFGRYRYNDPRPDELPENAAPIEYPALYEPPAVADDVELPASVEQRAKHHPHESPWTMTASLVLLAGLAVFAGLLNLPFGGWHNLEKFLEPSLAGNEAHIDASGGLKVGLGAIAVIVAVVGVAVALGAYLRNKRSPKTLEPEVLAEGWYYDQTVSNFMGGPGRKAFEAVAWFDRTIIDGAVVGTGRAVQAASTGLQRVQNGFVRSYAALLASGGLLLLAYFLLRATL